LTELTHAAALYAQEGMQERELTARWRIAQLLDDERERRTIEHRAETLGVRDLETWAPIRTPGFWTS
jgi:hypothetical protein